MAWAASLREPRARPLRGEVTMGLDPAQPVVDHQALAVGRSFSCIEVSVIQAPRNVQQSVRDVVVLAVASVMESGMRFISAPQNEMIAVSPGLSLLERGIPRVVLTFGA